MILKRGPKRAADSARGRDGRGHVDWLFRPGMTLHEDRKAAEEQRGKGLYPLLLVSHGDGANVRYAAVWVRFQIPDEAGQS